jgi:hypothetical protein
VAVNVTGAGAGAGAEAAGGAAVVAEAVPLCTALELALLLLSGLTSFDAARRRAWVRRCSGSASDSERGDSASEAAAAEAAEVQREVEAEAGAEAAEAAEAEAMSELAIGGAADKVEGAGTGLDSAEDEAVEEVDARPSPGLTTGEEAALRGAVVGSLSSTDSRCRRAWRCAAVGEPAFREKEEVGEEAEKPKVGVVPREPSPKCTGEAAIDTGEEEEACEMQTTAQHSDLHRTERRVVMEVTGCAARTARMRWMSRVSMSLRAIAEMWPGRRATFNTN